MLRRAASRFRELKALLASISNTASHCAEWKESRMACIAASVPDI